MQLIFNKQKGFILVFLLALIVVAEFVIESAHFPTWPAFMAMIFFFVNHNDPKSAPGILIGGAFGIFNVFIIKYWYGLTVPMLGGDLSKFMDPSTQQALFYSKLIYIVIFVALIVLFMDVLPWLFNNFAFMYFIVAGLAGTANTMSEVIAKTVAGTAVAAAGTDPAAAVAVKAATDGVVAAMVPTTSVFAWIGVELIGGGLLILIIIGVLKLLVKLMTSAEAPPPAHG